MNDSRVSPPTGNPWPVPGSSEKSTRGVENVREFPHTRRSDADLLRGVMGGDEAALSVIWRRYAASVRRTLRGNLGSDESLDDLTQEVFLSLVSNASRVENPDRLRAYLCGIAVRKASRKRRERARRGRFLWLFAHEVNGQSCGPVVQHRAALRRLDAILSEMPGRLRESFVLRFVEGMPSAEVAEARGVSLATAKRDVARAQERVLLRASRDEELSAYMRSTRESGEAASNESSIGERDRALSSDADSERGRPPR